MKVLKYPVVPIILLLAAGIATGSYINSTSNVLYIYTIVAFIIFITTYWFSFKTLLPKPYFTISTGFLAFIIGMLVFSLHYPPNHATHYTHLLTNKETPLIKGYISERIKPNDFNEKYYFKIQSINKQHATGKLLVTVPKNDYSHSLNAGDIIIIYETPKLVTKIGNPHQFDYAAYMEKQNVFHQIKLKNNYIEVGQIKNFDYYTEYFRNILINSFEKHNYSPQVMNVIKALLLGQRQDMDKDINQDYIDAGVIHILAISGLHIGILFYILRLLLKPLNHFSKRGRLLQLLITLTFLWIFAIIAGLSASIVRAVVMFSFVSIGLYFNRNANIFNSIAVSMLVLLLVKPAFLFDVGFQLSYAAVFAIVWMQPLYRKIKVSRYKAVNYFIDIVVISLVAQLGVLPLSLYYFSQFPILFPIANIVAIPLVTIALILGIIVLALNFIYSDLALLVGKFLSLLVEFMNSFINCIASFKNFVIKDIPFTLLLTISFYTIIAFGVLWGFKKEYKRMIALLCAVVVFQIIYTTTKWQADNNEAFVIFNNYNNSLAAHKQHNSITFYTNDGMALENRNIKAYAKGSFTDSITILPLQNTLYYMEHKILVIDSLGIYNRAIQPDILVLAKSPKINLERLLDTISPKVIIADATNYKSYITRWKATCRKKKIPFHATAEKGSYIIK
ncbi:ComEC family competence protein [Flavobacterium arcticum]|uniref:ComEC family competence protein n=1 Tax=Flavobacterium arcticum TaxID=1784713 RepID=A0A345H9U2_9FLAO|nr:ComEC/Rec2 family competence protein [Flavobacterium arcticum]AXG73352.1 ComEC family competence protein [Flavobacterium arcticum]KAF2513144.1 ComEC family competence protein [Flavobacterium arcticum]